MIGIVYGAVVACAQRDLKRLVTYSSLAQIGFIALGTIAISTQGLAGGVLLMVNHGLIVGGLFILIGFIYQRRGTWQTGEMRGLQKAAPVMAAVFTVAMLASIGVPGLNGFVSEFLVLSGTFLTHRWWAVVAVARGDRGRHLPAVGLPAGLPRRATPGRRADPRPGAAGAAGHGAPDHPDRLPGRVPQAGARPHQPVGEPAGRATSSRVTGHVRSRSVAVKGVEGIK